MPDSPLPVVNPSKPLYRIARKPDPWLPPDWARAGDDRTFGNRFDDSKGYFRVLYASSTPLGCFIETLARFRQSPPELMIALAQIANVEPDCITPGRVPGSWFTARMIGTAVTARGQYADIYSSAALAYLRRTLEPELLTNREDLDLAVLMSQDRTLTQQIATQVYQLGYDGIYYPSRHGHDLHNWALFEPFDLNSKTIHTLDISHPDLPLALDHLHLQVDLSR